MGNTKDRPDLSDMGRAILYRIGGLPAGQEAFIGRLMSGWQITMVQNGFQTEWQGAYSSDEEAVAALSRQLENEANAGNDRAAERERNWYPGF